MCAVVVVAINVYILVHFQHPEDRNQAWWPKIVVVRARSTSIHPRRAREARPRGEKERRPHETLPLTPTASPVSISSRCSA